jgi:SAM-dependent methyltransferase
MTTDSNREKYNDPEIVALYEKAAGLQPCEEAIFERWLKPGMVILDIGVGGGRTAPHLAQIAGRYVGVDYSQTMVYACRRRFPNLDFRHGDATDLNHFSDGEFDAVVFSFNGIDVIRTDEGRASCLREIARLLKTDGYFIFSSHNAKMLALWPQVSSAKGFQIPSRIFRSLYKSLQMSAKALVGKPFYAGQGYVLDPVHGGMHHYVSAPSTMTPQLKTVGLEVVDVIGRHYPDVQSLYLTPWHYYACRKTGAA